MLSPLRNRFGIPGVISVIALVFAMLGGAYAASDNGGSGDATASAKGKKGPPGKRGKPGPPGPAGPAGPAGSAGAKGDTGAKGDKGDTGNTGAAGAPGTSVTSEEFGVAGKEGKCVGTGGSKFTAGASKTFACNGKNGEDGEDGQTGFTETLPSGESETGTWGFRVPPITSGLETVVPISFPIPLAQGGLDSEVTGVRKAFYFTAAQVTGEEFEYENEVTAQMEDSGCRWEIGNSDATPEATKPGTLCVFGEEESLASIELKYLRPPGELGVRGYAPSGAYLYMNKEVTPSPASPGATGTWAVTAP